MTKLPADALCRTVQLVNSRGLHARASAKFVKVADSFSSQIAVEKEGISVCGTSIMGLMLLAAACGDQLVIRAHGADANDALEALTGLIEKRFHEAD